MDRLPPAVSHVTLTHQPAVTDGGGGRRRGTACARAIVRVTEGLAEKHGDHRVQNTPLDESGILGAAIGLAMGGMRPVPEIQFEPRFRISCRRQYFDSQKV